MCLGVPGRVISVNGEVADVDFWGVRRQVRLDLVNEPVGPGDYILNHVGFAIRRIPTGDIAATLALYEEVLRDDASADLMTADVRAELAAAPVRPTDAAEATVVRRSLESEGGE